MFKLLTVSLIAALAIANSIETIDTAASWPEINIYESFKASTEIFLGSDDDKNLTSMLGMKGNLKVDGGRSKVFIDGKINMDWLGNIGVQVLVDFKNGTIYYKFPILGNVC